MTARPGPSFVQNSAHDRHITHRVTRSAPPPAQGRTSSAPPATTYSYNIPLPMLPSNSAIAQVQA